MVYNALYKRRFSELTKDAVNRIGEGDYKGAQNFLKEAKELTDKLFKPQNLSEQIEFSKLRETAYKRLAEIYSGLFPKEIVCSSNDLKSRVKSLAERSGAEYNLKSTDIEEIIDLIGLSIDKIEEREKEYEAGIEKKFIQETEEDIAEICRIAGESFSLPGDIDSLIDNLRAASKRLRDLEHLAT